MLMAVFAIGLCSGLLAEERREYPQVSLCGPGGSKTPISRDDYIVLVVEGPTLSYEANPIPGADVVEFVNHLLQVKKVSYIGVYPREGTKYGDVVHAVDLLRGTSAKNIGVSMKELPLGREP
jgi:biopolymer transport protein ExbD